MKQLFIVLLLMQSVHIWGNAPQNIPDPIPKHDMHKSDVLSHHAIPSNTENQTSMQQKNNSGTPWTIYLSTLIEQSDSLILRLCLVLLLGILLSFTPCIYPMIPITVGILHQHANSNLLQNFLRSAAYSCGIATTFAVLGLAAAFAGQLFGSMLANPFVVTTIIGILAYFGFSMMGFYEPHLPIFLTNNRSNPSGSFVSCFIFGAVSGLVASPCVSPGLLFLLTLVTTLANKFLGFLFLFIFGIGLSTPLLILGTSSSLLSLLPRAGAWMVETKKIFGICMIAMCFYFARSILPYEWILSTSIIASILASFWYGSQAKHHTILYTRIFYYSMATIFVSYAGYIGYYWYIQYHKQPQALDWYTDYAQARQRAQKEHKYIFVDINTPYCVLCKGIEHTILNTPQVTEALTSCIPVVIDGSDQTIIAHQNLQKKYHIKGVPALLLIDAQSEEIIKQWGGELYGTDPRIFAQEINQLT